VYRKANHCRTIVQDRSGVEPKRLTSILIRFYSLRFGCIRNFGPTVVTKMYRFRFKFEYIYIYMYTYEMCSKSNGKFFNFADLESSIVQHFCFYRVGAKYDNIFGCIRRVTFQQVASLILKMCSCALGGILVCSNTKMDRRICKTTGL